MEKKRTSFVRGAVILAMAGLLVKIIGALFRIPLANAIGPIGSSYYEVAYPYYSWLLVISSSGLPTAISKMVSERITLGDYRGAHRVFTTAVKLLAVVGVITSAIMYFGAGALASVSTLDRAVLSFRALAPALLFVSIMCAYRGYLQGMQRMTGTAISQVIEQVVKLVIGLTLAIKMFPMGPEYGAMGALIGVSLSEFIALLAIMVIYRKQAPAIRRLRESSRETAPLPVAGPLMSIAIPITIGASISPLSGIVDSALIIRILTNLGYQKDLAQTAFALLRTNVTTLTNMPGVLTMALAMSLVPAISAASARRNRENLRAVARLGLKLALIIGLPCAAGLFVLAGPILTMLYPALTAAQLSLATDLLRTASVGVLFLSLVQAMTGTIQGMGKPQIPVFNLFIGFVLKVVTLVILMNIPSINIQGAAVSTVICYAFAGLADTFYAVRKTGMHIAIWDVVLKPVVSTAVMGAMVYLCNNMISRLGHATLAAAVSVLMGMLVYAILAIYLRMFTRDELNLIPGGTRIKKIMYGD